MKKLLLIVCASLFLSACGGTKTDNTSSNSESEKKTETVIAEKPKVGDNVAAPYYGSKNLSDGIVESIEGSRYKIKFGDSTNMINESDVYVLPKADVKPQVKAGDMVAAKIKAGKQWAIAEVVSVSNNLIEVKDVVGGSVSSVAFDKIIVVRPDRAAE